MPFLAPKEPRERSVGADAHIGPLGSDEFAEDFQKKRHILRADRVVRPYEIREAIEAFP